jgi:predicted aspartyl protease
MPDYDAKQFNPPAPLARVTVRTRDHAKVVSDVPMLIDSGSDTTLIPQTLAQRLDLHGEAQEVLIGFDGRASAAEVVNAEVVFQGHVFRGEFPLIDDEVGILGRNVLNRFSLVLDGPGLSWRESP